MLEKERVQMKWFEKTMYGKKKVLLCKSKLDPSYSNNNPHYMDIGIMVHILMLCIAILFLLALLTLYYIALAYHTQYYSTELL